MTDKPDTSAQSFSAEVPVAAFLLPLGLGALLFLWPTFRGLAGVYRTDGNFSHGFLVPVISAYALWQMRSTLKPRFSRSSLWGFPLFGGGMGLILFARWYELALLPRGVIAMFLSAIGVVAVLAGMAWIALGWPHVKRVAFPIGFLLLGVPIPSFLLNRITLPLQRLAATLSCQALHLVGVAVERQGNVLHFDTGTLGVAEACSGIRSLAVLTALVALMIHFQRPRKLVAAALVAAIVPAAVFGNMIRVFCSGVFYAFGWKQLAHGGPHELLGLFTFGLAIVLIFGLGNLLSRRASPVVGEPGSKRGVASATIGEGGAVPGVDSLANAAFCCAFLFFAGATLSFHIGSHYDRLHAEAISSRGKRLPLAQFPAVIGPYVRVGTSSLSESEFRMLDPSDCIIALYRGPDKHLINVSILYWDPPKGRPSERPDLLKRPHSPDWCFPAAGWHRLSAFDEDRTFDVFPDEIGSVRLFERNGKRRVLLFWTGITAARTDSPDQMRLRLLDMIHSWNHPPLANLHTITLGMDAGSDPKAARETLLRFAEMLDDILPTYGIGER